MTLGMCDAVDTEESIKKIQRPKSALSSAYERIRQFVRPKIRPKHLVNPNTYEDHKTQPDPPKAERNSKVEKLHGLAYACERREQMRKEQGKAVAGKYPSAAKNNKVFGAWRGNQHQRRKHRKRRPYAREDSEDTSSSDSEDSDDGIVDNRDLWFLTRKGIDLEKKLGEGTYAQVRAGRQVKPNRQVAVKIISLEKTNQRYRVKFLPRETELLRKVDHPNIIRLFETLRYENKVFFVTELAQRGDLLGYIQRHRVLGVSVARTIFAQIVDAIDYLHRRGMYHRDLKCENILLDPGHKVKLTDFGFAREWYEPNHLCRTYCGSAAYASPEIMQGLPYEPSTADIWSMGIVLFVMVQGKMPFDDSDVKKMVSTVLRYDVDFSPRRPLSTSLKSLLRSILNHGQWSRASLCQIRRNAWLEGHKSGI